MPRSRRERFAAALLLTGASWPLMGCPLILGIDGDYVTETADAGRGGDATRADASRRKDGTASDSREASSHDAPLPTSDACESGSPTRITGVVMDPGMNVGLANVSVYIATGLPITFVDPPASTGLPACDSCASLGSPGFATAVLTGPDGSFALPTSAGTYTVIAQVGRWRRIVSDVSVASCADTVIPPDAVRLPANHSEGDIPMTALVEGGKEPLECWLAKVGISTSEIAPFGGAGDARVRLFEPEGSSAAGNTAVPMPGEEYWTGMTSAFPPTADALWDAPALFTFSQILVACDENGAASVSTTEQLAVLNYANAGGRLFLNHDSGVRVINGSATWGVASVATWDLTATTPTSPRTMQALDTSPAQIAFTDWLAPWDPPVDGGAAGTFPVTTARRAATAAGSNALTLLKVPSISAIGSFWFDTPLASLAPAASCGRVVFNDMHVPLARSSNTTGYGTGSQADTFPQSCTTGPLSPEELALEYELFALSDCRLAN